MLDCVENIEYVFSVNEVDRVLKTEEFAKVAK